MQSQWKINATTHANQCGPKPMQARAQSMQNQYNSMHTVGKKVGWLTVVGLIWILKWTRFLFVLAFDEAVAMRRIIQQAYRYASNYVCVYTTLCAEIMHVCRASRGSDLKQNEMELHRVVRNMYVPMHIRPWRLAQHHPTIISRMPFFSGKFTKHVGSEDA